MGVPEFLHPSPPTHSPKRLSQVVDPPEGRRRPGAARRRWKYFVRYLIHQLSWLTTEQAKHDILRRSIHEEKVYHTGRFNYIHKMILLKPCELRTEAEKQYLWRAIQDFKCYRPYPDNAKVEIVDLTTFACFGANRVIVREGDPMQALYFIVKGEAAVSKLSESRGSSIISQVTYMHTLSPGDSFGDPITDIDYWDKTVISITPIEVIYIYREDFDFILEHTIKTEWDNTRRQLRLFRNFDDYTDNELEEFAMRAKTFKYKPNETILGDGCGKANYAYFLVQGECQLIEALFIENTVTKSGSPRMSLYNPPTEPDAPPRKKKIKFLIPNDHKATQVYQIRHLPSILQAEETGSIPDEPSISSSHSGVHLSHRSSSHHKMKRRRKLSKLHRDIARLYDDEDEVYASSFYFLPKNIDIFFMQVCVFNPGTVFGIGENLHHRRVVAMNKTICLGLPRYLLQSRRWLRLKNYLNSFIPNTHEVYHEFMQQRKWRAYKRDLIDSFHSLVKLGTVIQCVPYSIRIEHDYDYTDHVISGE